ncbi:MAG: aldehyde dehydrogenase family protein, partial [Sphingorhabdus sp.]|nr:aldehyde dehydrogenase family protein [Sphingorhabdus sp.]
MRQKTAVFRHSHYRYFWPKCYGNPIFGPVLSIIKYSDEADAVRIANASEFGLGGSVWSADSAHATDVARRVESGTVGVNGYMPALG